MLKIQFHRRPNCKLKKNEDKKEYRSSPPLARPLYRPAPPHACAQRCKRDFSDLPGTTPSADEANYCSSQESNHQQWELASTSQTSKRTEMVLKI